MRITFVLGEHRTDTQSIVFEKLFSPEAPGVFRVTSVRRFGSLDAAADYFLRAVPKSRRQKLSAEIAAANKKRPSTEEQE